MYTHRRSFLKQMSTFAGALALTQLPKSVLAAARAADMPVGFQTFPIRDMLAKDFSGTLKMMAANGYRLTEMCSPKGYANIGYGPLVGMKPSEMRKIIHDSGLECPSCHFGNQELVDHLDESIEFAQGLGLSQMILSSFGLPKTGTLNDWDKACDKLNSVAEKIKAAGMQAGYHNHDMEFAMLDGQLIYDELLRRFDPNLVKMQFQTQVITLGYKAATYFNKYPGRFISSHLSDWTTDKKPVPIGKGIIDWNEFFAAAKTGGVKNFFVEMDLKDMEPSAKNIHSLIA